MIDLTMDTSHCVRERPTSLLIADSQNLGNSADRRGEEKDRMGIGQGQGLMPVLCAASRHPVKLDHSNNLDAMRIDMTGYLLTTMFEGCVIRGNWSGSANENIHWDPRR